MKDVKPWHAASWSHEAAVAYLCEGWPFVTGIARMEVSRSLHEAKPQPSSAGSSLWQGL